jgi:hypothetical protein
MKQKEVIIKPSERLIVKVMARYGTNAVRHMHGQYELMYDSKLEKMIIRKMHLSSVWR